MRRLIAASAPEAALALGCSAGAPQAAQADVVWLCRPGEQPNPCRETQRTTIYDADGSSRVEDKPLPAKPPVDCFFVYPTVSGQPSTNANKDKDDELIAIARYQAARFSERCRIYAPVYRQLTLASIFSGTPQQREEGGKLAYSDVREAWRSYLANDNRGRGVVLVGHSQGTRMLRQLLREEVDPNPAVRRRLVSGILLGGNVLVRKGQRAGGDFNNTPACSHTGETGCVIAFSTYFDPPPPNSRFGRSPASDTSGAGFPAGPDYEVVCNNPASLAGNARTPLTTYARSEPFPGSIGAALVQTYGGPPPSAPTPWLRPSERYTGQCVREDGAHTLRLAPIGSARRLNPAPDPTWGTHLVDVNIVLGELVDEVGAQTRAYLAAARNGCLARRSPIGRRGVGRVRLGRTRAQIARRTKASPVRLRRYSAGWCVKGSSRRVTAVSPAAARRAEHGWWSPPWRAIAWAGWGPA
ncbi:MAG: DUF3089 domain-containing protein [Actinomycetota bacterium]